MKKTLPTIKITDKTNSNIQFALSKYNETANVPLTLQDFRRLAYEFLSQTILKGEVIPVKLTRE